MNYGLMVPILIASLTVIDALERWYRSFDIDVQEGSLLPCRFIAWGTVRSLNKKYAEDRRYFMIRIPGIYWEMNPYQDACSWHYHALFWFEGCSWGWGGWRVVSSPA